MEIVMNGLDRKLLPKCSSISWNDMFHDNSFVEALNLSETSALH